MKYQLVHALPHSPIVNEVKSFFYPKNDIIKITIFLAEDSVTKEDKIVLSEEEKGLFIEFRPFFKSHSSFRLPNWAEVKIELFRPSSDYKILLDQSEKNQISVFLMPKDSLSGIDTIELKTERVKAE